ncbi:hypothetical protein [Komagataeibacter oboediens]|uniref:hypothetical protein n=1 Tax=Komagataeibacter oboediens TaxID=65958 RepID=UPI0012F4C5C2|nr:hypothetical protein [Komagataeibacter oboediens]
MTKVAPPNVGDHCITGVKHNDDTDHRASIFHLHKWAWDKIHEKYRWHDLGWKNSDVVAKLLIEKICVYSAK